MTSHTTVHSTHHVKTNKEVDCLTVFLTLSCKQAHLIDTKHEQEKVNNPYKTYHSGG